MSVRYNFTFKLMKRVNAVENDDVVILEESLDFVDFRCVGGRCGSCSAFLSTRLPYSCHAQIVPLPGECISYCDVINSISRIGY